MVFGGYALCCDITNTHTSVASLAPMSLCPQNAKCTAWVIGGLIPSVRRFVAVGIVAIHHVTLRFSPFNMSTIFESSVQSQEVSGKNPGPQLHHSEPVHEVDPDSTIVKHVSEQQDLAALLNWLRTPSTRLFKIQNISLEQAEGLESTVREAGYKVRYVNIASKGSFLLIFRKGTTGAAPI